MAEKERDIAGCVLAGGLGRRLGGVDKGLVTLAGRPLAAHALERLAPQVNRVMISANRNADTYRTLCDLVVADASPDFDGPLAGMAAAMAATEAPLLAVVPCDSPFFPRDLVTRLAAALDGADGGIATVRSAGRLQPAFALLDRRLHGALLAALARGERRIARFYAAQGAVEVEFTDTVDAFDNINTPDDLAAAERRVACP